MQYRSALPHDRDSIVALHVDGGQRAYANILSADYLANVMPLEKSELWQARLSNGIDGAKISVTVADASPDIAGFACFLFTEETEFGTYLHNIYVSASYQRQGIASGLIAAGIAAFPAARQQQPVHLLVFADNHPARAFYDRMGGKVIQESQKARAGSAAVKLVRYQWPSAEKLQQKVLGSKR